MLCICLWSTSVKAVDKWCKKARTGVMKGFQVTDLPNTEINGIKNCDDVNNSIKKLNWDAFAAQAPGAGE